jgi:hypothetical protein
MRRTAYMLTASDLERWAETKEAAYELPRLIRRLILATDPEARSSFRAGEGVQLPGWDGEVESPKGSPFVPKGKSVWELGTNKRISRKANEDYEKRKANPGNLPPSQVTFVFVTPRRWRDKSNWQEEKNREGFWREVRAYDADDLEAWLEAAPGVCIGFSALVNGRPQEDIKDLETFWQGYSRATSPPLPSELLLSGNGRRESAKKLLEWIRGSSPLLHLVGETPEETVAFLWASLGLLPDEDREAILARTLVVKTSQALESLLGNSQPLILVPLHNLEPEVSAQARERHRLLLPRGREEPFSKGEAAIVLPPLGLKEATEVLTSLGFSLPEADELARLARRSLQAFRRKLAPAFPPPQWAGPEAGPHLVPLLLAGAWDEVVEGDKEVISSLTGRAYEDARQLLEPWLHRADPPLIHRGTRFYSADQRGALDFLRRYVNSSHLHRLREEVLRVLGTPDPGLVESSPLEALSDTFPYSIALRRGLADALAILASQNDSEGSAAAKELPSGIVRELLQKSNEDWRIWATLGALGALPSLAEAAPDVFLKGVEEGLSKAEGPIAQLLSHQYASFHVGLLRALETLAWDPNRLSYATLILARLERLDPGGNVHPRPLDSLTNIFRPWWPQTSASRERRLRVLETLRNREGEVAWRVMLQLLRTLRGGPLWSNPTPRFRPWHLQGKEEAAFEWDAKLIEFLLDRLQEDAGQNGFRWKELLEAFQGLPSPWYPCFLERALRRLKDLSLQELSAEERSALYDALRSILSLHRSFPDSWGLPHPIPYRLARLMRKLAPEDPVERFGWLFTSHPDLPEGNPRHLRDWEKAVRKARIKAADEVYRAGGLARLLDMAAKVEMPYALGYALAHLKEAAQVEDEVLARYLAGPEGASASFALGFAQARVEAMGPGWALQKLQALGPRWAPAQKARLLVLLPPTPKTWRLAAQQGEQTERLYWENLSPYAIQGHVEEALSHYLRYGVTGSALTLLAWYYQQIPPALTLEVLEAFVTNPPAKESVPRDLGFWVGRLIEHLENSDQVKRERLVRVAWAFLPAFPYDGQPRILHEELARDPSFFLDILSAVYPAEGEEPREVSKEESLLAELAFLLNSWRTLPGLREDGSLDEEALRNWVMQARALAQNRGRGKIADHVIGQMLSGSPRGPDGFWPHPAVRELIEELASPNLESGVHVGLFNSRGVFVKDPSEGGRQERELAEGYRRQAVALADSWPRTAAILRELAETYERQAQAEDQLLEIWQDL